MDNLIKISDALEDLAEKQGEIAAAIGSLKLRAPDIHVAAPPATVTVYPPAPVVKVEVESPEPVAWEFRITERDSNDMIRKFTATPILK